MSTDHNPPRVVAPKLASLAAALVVIVGAMVLVGWAFDIAVLKSVLPGWVAMKANTAVCFVLIGIALWLTARQPAIFTPERSGRSFSYGNRTAYSLRVQLSTFFARLCGLLAGLVGLLTLGEYIFGWNPGIDQWLICEAAGAVGTSDPGRMAPETALCFVLLAAALWITGSSRKTRRAMLAPMLLGLLVTILALVAWLSYPTPGLGAFGWFGLTIMAMHTSVLFVMLGVAVMAISWRQDVLQWSLGRNNTAAFVCGLAVLVLVGFNTNRSQFWLNETNRKIAHSEAVLTDISGIETELIDIQVNASNYAVVGDERFQKFYLESIADYNKEMNALRQLVADSPHQQQQISLIETNANLLLRWSQQFIDTLGAGMSNASRSKMAGDGEDLQDKLRAAINQIQNEHKQFIRELHQELESVARFSYITIATGTLASLLIFLIVIFRLNFAVNERKQAENALRESEVDIRALVEHSPVAIIVDVGVDADEKIIMMNRKFTALFGYTMEDVPDVLHWWPLAYPDEKYREEVKAEWIGKVGKAIQSHANIEPMETTVTCKDGTSRYIRFSLSSIGSRNIITFEDFTERKRAEELLQNVAAKFHTVFELSADAIMLFDEKGFFDCNKATLRMFGCPTRDEFIGKHPAELSPPTQPGGEDSMNLANQRIATAFKNGSNRFEWTHRRLDGTEFYAEVSLTVLELDGKPVLQATVRDITERNQTQSRLAEQFEELRRWHDATMGRETRTLELKHEVNELLVQAGQPPRYPSAEADDKEYPDV